MKCPVCGKSFKTFTRLLQHLYSYITSHNLLLYATRYYGVDIDKEPSQKVQEHICLCEILEFMLRLELNGKKLSIPQTRYIRRELKQYYLNIYSFFNYLM